MALAAGVGVAAVGVGVTAYESNKGQKAAEKAADAAKPKDVPHGPTGVTDTAESLKAANLLSQTAGGSLLSDPVQDARSGKQTGTLPGAGKSLLGN